MDESAHSHQMAQLARLREQLVAAHATESQLARPHHGQSAYQSSAALFAQLQNHSGGLPNEAVQPAGSYGYSAAALAVSSPGPGPSGFSAADLLRSMANFQTGPSGSDGMNAPLSPRSAHAAHLLQQQHAQHHQEQQQAQQHHHQQDANFGSWRHAATLQELVARLPPGVLGENLPPQHSIPTHAPMTGGGRLQGHHGHAAVLSDINDQDGGAGHAGGSGHSVGDTAEHDAMAAYMQSRDGGGINWQHMQQLAAQQAQHAQQHAQQQALAAARHAHTQAQHHHQEMLGPRDGLASGFHTAQLDADSALAAAYAPDGAAAPGGHPGLDLGHRGSGPVGGAAPPAALPPPQGLTSSLQRARKAPALAAPALPEGKGTVLAAKVLTESDVKHARAILPRVAVENNLPFLLGYRTYGIYLPDHDGRQWEFVFKSWANGRADRGQRERRADRRVYVMEQMAPYLARHKLRVGDVIGIVAADGRLEVQCQTAALRAWVERPVYGAPQLAEAPVPVPDKCSVLEDALDIALSPRQCARSAVCTKPDGHSGFCASRADGHVAALGATLKLTMWPPPSGKASPQHLGADARELRAADILPGALLTLRVRQRDLDSGTAAMPRGAVIKVPVHLAGEPALRLRVTDPGRGEHELAAAAVPEAPADTAALSTEVAQISPWEIRGLAPVFAALKFGVSDELCIERDGDRLLLHRMAAAALPPLSADVQVLQHTVAPPPSAYGVLLCQRTQGCMKAINHTGFCAGHKGFRRKGGSAGGHTGEDGLGGSGPPAGGGAKRKRSEGKRRSAPAAKRGAPTGADDDWVPSTHVDAADAAGGWRRRSSGVSLHSPTAAIPQPPAAASPRRMHELTTTAAAAADALLAMSGGEAAAGVHAGMSGASGGSGDGGAGVPGEPAVPMPALDVPPPLVPFAGGGADGQQGKPDQAGFLDELMSSAVDHIRAAVDAPGVLAAGGSDADAAHDVPAGGVPGGGEDEGGEPGLASEEDVA